MKNACKNSMNKLLAAVLAAGILAGCMGRELVRVNPKTESYILTGFPVQDFIGVDVLVVVDNSGSMADEQTMLREAFPRLIESVLTGRNLDTGEQVHEPVRDLHIGVVSTDMGVGGFNVQTCEEYPMFGDDGILQHTPRGAGCESAYPNFLSYEIDKNADPDIARVQRLAGDFGCIAVLGTSGCGFEQQLEAAYKALTTHSVPGGANAGFLREDTILTILFVTDEEDCSAADVTLFDIGALPYSVNLQCYYQAAKLHAIDRYFRAFKGLRGNPDSPEISDNLVIGFIVGVPPGEPLCNGRGNDIAECLNPDLVPTMVEKVRPDGELLEYVCKYPTGCTPAVDCSGEAFPARRFVQLAQAFGDNAVVQSICTDSFVPAVQALTEKLVEIFNKTIFSRQLQVAKDPFNNCRCEATCIIIEELSDNRPCPDGKPPYDSNGDTIPETSIDDETGQVHTLCLIPQAGSIINNRENCDMACDDPDATHTKDPDRVGWWYNPYGDVDTDGDTVTEKVPTVSFEGAEPESGSGVSIQCSSVVCPEARQCGASGTLSSKCCDANEYCRYSDPLDKTNEGYCLLRRDICEEYGDDVWCPDAGPPDVNDFVGGLCCLDPDMDGRLDWVLEDVNGDGVGDLPDYPLFYCAGNTCQPRP